MKNISLSFSCRYAPSKYKDTVLKFWQIFTPCAMINRVKINQLKRPTVANKPEPTTTQ